MEGCGSIRTTEVEIECSEIHGDSKYMASNNYDKGYSKLKLKCFFINAKSLTNNFKMYELERSALGHNYLDIICVVETRQNDTVLDGEIGIKEYITYRKDRANVKYGRGCGVVLYVRNRITNIACEDLNKHKSECLVQNKYCI